MLAHHTLYTIRIKKNRRYLSLPDGITTVRHNFMYYSITPPECTVDYKKKAVSPAADETLVFFLSLLFFHNHYKTTRALREDTIRKVQISYSSGGGLQLQQSSPPPPPPHTLSLSLSLSLSPGLSLLHAVFASMYASMPGYAHLPLSVSLPISNPYCVCGCVYVCFCV